MKHLPILATIVISICLVTLSFFYKNLKGDTVQGHKTNTELLDSVNKYKSKSFYLNKLWLQGLKNRSIKINNELEAYKLENSQRIKVNLDTFFLKKPALVIRYTQIGCNACLDSTFKILPRFNNLKKYNIITIVDFQNQDYYIKWRKISEFNGSVYWIRKGDIKFPIDHGSDSYIFTVNKSSRTENFFIPNSNHVQYLKEYLKEL